MTQEKIKRFFDIAVAKTKSRKLSWSRISLPDSHNFTNVDLIRSFMSKYDSGKIFILRDSEDDTINCWVIPGSNLGCYQVGEDNDSSLLRLYNLVYSLFPSIDSFIDGFIASEDSDLNH